ncbi:glycine--tRNA ligase subunit beta [Betaproteobacteria bacterium]|nr:glycine--tRNA ligase subunit beta [Betaproteobacteria bacterium]
MSNFLIEIFTEELPPTALKNLSTSLAELSLNFLSKDELIGEEPKYKIFATPRRLGFLIQNVSSSAPNRKEKVRLVPKEIGLGKRGEILPPLENKIKSLLKNKNQQDSFIESKYLQKIYTEDINGKDFIFIDILKEGITLEESVQKNFPTCLKNLPVPKLMKYQKVIGQEIKNDIEFIRPVRGFVSMIDNKLINMEVLGLHSSNSTNGHRFLGQDQIKIKSAMEYESQLFELGKVIVDFEERREKINRSIMNICNKENCKSIIDNNLLDEITALCEWPKALLCYFDNEFLSLPKECLILTMQKHQKYIPLSEEDGRLSNKFIVITNNDPKDSSKIVTGNERVLRARLNDAHFFFLKDQEKPLIERKHELSAVMYHNLLGTLSDRTKRIKSLLIDWGEKIKLDTSDCITLSEVSKNDLVTLMVNEFPELQGIIGKYYYLSDGGKPYIAEAIEGQYKPRYSGDSLPEGRLAKSLALADKFELLAGLISIDLMPSGDKDPYAMRRNTLGILSILMSEQFEVTLDYLIESSLSIFVSTGKKREVTIKKMQNFISDRLFYFFKEQGYRADCIMACMKFAFVDTYSFPFLLKELEKAAINIDSEKLFLINKRIKNILDKAEISGKKFESIDQNLFVEKAEKDLFAISIHLCEQIKFQIAHNQFDKYLKSCVGFKKPIENFFENVLVNVDDTALRNNRIFLLSHVHSIMNQLVDLSLVSKGRNEQ